MHRLVSEFPDSSSPLSRSVPKKKVELPARVAWQLRMATFECCFLLSRFSLLPRNGPTSSVKT